MRFVPVFAVVATLVSFGGTAAAAATITGLYNTGVDAAGVATTGNGADLHWTLAEGTAFTGAQNGVFPLPPWLAETTVSRWLTPGPVAGQDFDPSDDGFYNYSLAFSLAGRDPASAEFTGRFSVDNLVTGITLNGMTIAGSGGTFTEWFVFDSTGGSFVAGLNTLSFRVENGAQAAGNPTGLRVEFLSSAANAVPEPATWAMLVAGFGLVGAAARRRRPGAVAA